MIVMFILCPHFSIYGQEIPMRGMHSKSLAHLDQIVLREMKQHQIVGSSVAISFEGRLVFVRGYGYADLAAKIPVFPITRFNLASCSKPVTAIAILKLVDEGKLNLDKPIFSFLKSLHIPKNGKADKRLKLITTRHLLNHSSGFQRSFKAIRKYRSVVEELQAGLIEPLLFDPGTQSKYSNYAFTLLKLIVTEAAGETDLENGYEKFVISKILHPMEIKQMKLAETLDEDYSSNEAKRYFCGSKELILHPGLSHIKANSSWLASSVDVMRFMTAIDGSRSKDFLSQRSINQMFRFPPPPYQSKNKSRHFGLGWDMVERSPEGVHYSKNGGLAGTATWMEHFPNGVNLTILFNSTVKGKEEDGPRQWRAPIREAVQNIKKWPNSNFFPTFEAKELKLKN